MRPNVAPNRRRIGHPGATQFRKCDDGNLSVMLVSMDQKHRNMRREFFFCLILLLAATSALAQVQVDVRLEKNRYLAGEPVAVLVEVRNVGDEAVEYSTCDGDVRLAIAGAERRVRPNVFGCFSGMGTGGAALTILHYFSRGRRQHSSIC